MKIYLHGEIRSCSIGHYIHREFWSGETSSGSCRNTGSSETNLSDLLLRQFKASFICERAVFDLRPPVMTCQALSLYICGLHPEELPHCKNGRKNLHQRGRPGNR